jgi:hypothetical protein
MFIAINLDGVGVFIGVATLLVGILSWWLSKLLSDKKDITVVQIKIENIERRVKELEDDVNDLQRKHHN